MGALSSLWPVVLTALITAIGTYIGFIHGLRIKVALLEHRIDKNELRLDRKSAQMDAFKDNIASIKSELKEDMAELKSEFAEMKGELKAISQTLELFTEEVMPNYKQQTKKNK